MYSQHLRKHSVITNQHRARFSLPWRDAFAHTNNADLAGKAQETRRRRVKLGGRRVAD